MGVKVGTVTIGGGHPVVVQSMTNTDTSDVESTARQVQELYVAGSELVRMTVNTEKAAVKVAVRAAKYPPVGNRSLGGGMHSMNFDATGG